MRNPQTSTRILGTCSKFVLNWLASPNTIRTGGLLTGELSHILKSGITNQIAESLSCDIPSPTYYVQHSFVVELAAPVVKNGLRGRLAVS